jgi:hypothetical protein
MISICVVTCFFYGRTIRSSVCGEFQAIAFRMRLVASAAIVISARLRCVGWGGSRAAGQLLYTAWTSSCVGLLCYLWCEYGVARDIESEQKVYADSLAWRWCEGACSRESSHTRCCKGGGDGKTFVIHYELIGTLCTARK